MALSKARLVAGYPEGDLSIDQRHRARLWVNYGVPGLRRLMLSVLQTIESGVPYGAVSTSGVNTHPYVTNPGYVSPPPATQTVYFFTARDAFRTEGQVRTCRIVTRPLFDDELVAIVAPRHPLAVKPFVEAADFATETLLSYSPKEESTVCQRLLIPNGVAPANLLQMQLTEAIIELAKAGLGIGVLARWAVQPHLRTGTLRALRLTRHGFKRTWSAATLKDLARVPYVREFIDLLAEHPPFATPSPAGRSHAGTTQTRGRSALPMPRVRA